MEESMEEVLPSVDDEAEDKGRDGDDVSDGIA